MCRACQAPILITNNPNGAWVLLDFAATPEGTFRLDGGVAVELAGADLAAAHRHGDALRQSHFLTCSEASWWRK
jgi:hypothetical protein